MYLLEIRRATNSDPYIAIYRGTFNPGGRLCLPEEIPHELADTLQELLYSTTEGGTHSERIGNSTYQASWRRKT